MVYLTKVTFGGYSSALKRMVDHQIQNISPFFAMKVAGETHHQKRYEKYPDFLAVGWTDALDPQAEAVFQHLRSSATGSTSASRPTSVPWFPRINPTRRCSTSAQKWLNHSAERSVVSAGGTAGKQRDREAGLRRSGVRYCSSAVPGGARAPRTLLGNTCSSN